MTRDQQERAELFDAIVFWNGAVIHAKDEETRRFARDRITALRCKLIALEGKRSWTADTRAVRAMQDDQDAEELF